MRFRHNDLADLDAKLAEHRVPRTLIVVDSLYSLVGDQAPIAGICDLADRYGAWVFLDDAHGCGVLGPGGRGLAHAAGVADRVPVIMGVLSKSFASTGGFIAGSAELIDHLRFNARSYLYSNALAPAQAAAALAVLDILAEEPTLPTRALECADHARRELRKMGWRCAGDGSQMVPILLGDDVLAFKITQALIAEGVLVSPAVHPGVPKGKDLLRIGFPPTMTEDEMERALGAFATVAAQFPEALETTAIPAVA